MSMVNDELGFGSYPLLRLLEQLWKTLTIIILSFSLLFLLAGSQKGEGG